jgi:nucleolar pre-ribosomal-associated protein 1
MNGIRNAGQGKDDPTIPKLIAVFLAESLQVMMNPQHILYEKVNSFFLQREALDLEDIPMFYTLSNSGEHFEREVDWLLDIMVAGVHNEMVVDFPSI